MTMRIIGSVVILVSIILLPYWVYLPLLFAGIIIFPFFWEGLVFAFLINVLHGSGLEVLSALASPLALITLLVLIALLTIKESIRTYV